MDLGSYYYLLLVVFLLSLDLTKSRLQQLHETVQFPGAVLVRTDCFQSDHSEANTEEVVK